MTARSDRRVALLAGGLLALVFTCWAAVQVAGWSVGAVEHTSRQTIPGPIRELRVDAGPGDITIVPALGDDVTISSRSRGSLHTPRLRAAVNGADVTLSGGCPALSFGRCNATITLHVPAGTAVRVHASSGDVAASGIAAPVRLITASGDVSASALSGGADLQTSSGDVRVRGLGGRVDLETASGDIDATDLRAGSVNAHTASGDVELGFVDPPSDVAAETSSGDVRVVVPRGAGYRVETETDHGDSEVGIPNDPTARRVIRARTSSGDAVVRFEN